MAKVDALDVFRSRQYDPLKFHFESLSIPNMYCYLTQQDIDQLRYIATSPRFSSKIDKKYEEIDIIMRNRGFKRFSAGTNRVVYRHLEDNRFLAKIAVDKVGMQDNPLEYQNQLLLKPFVTKMFQISQCGTVGFSERVLPIKHKAEFREVASDVFDILINKILGTYVVEDVGTKYFMNWGIRYGFGPVLLDYPYVYKLDGNKLYCTAIDQQTGCMCNGEIDYDVGFNKLVCTKCGKKYLATDLKDDTPYNKIIVKGGDEMKIRIKNNDKVVFESDGMDEFITRPKTTKPNTGDLKVRVLCNNKPINEVSEPKPIAEEVTPPKSEVVKVIPPIPEEPHAESNIEDQPIEEQVNAETKEDEVVNPDKSTADNIEIEADTESEPNSYPVKENPPAIEQEKEPDNEHPVVYSSKSDDFDTSVGAAWNSGFIKRNGNGKKNKHKKGKRSVVVIPTNNGNKKEDDK